MKTGKLVTVLSVLTIVMSPPIVRGKETKFVEFGVKAGNIQIDRISFIEHISFKVFNEGIRLKDCIRMH